MMLSTPTANPLGRSRRTTAVPPSEYEKDAGLSPGTAYGLGERPASTRPARPIVRSIRTKAYAARLASPEEP